MKRRHAGMIEKLYAESLGVACAIHLGTAYALGNKKIFAPKGKLSSHQLRTIVDLVHSCIHGTITLEDLAASIHLSVFHFSRLFKNTVGVSPYQYVLRLKIEYAQNLIKRKQSIGRLSHIRWDLPIVLTFVMPLRNLQDCRHFNLTWLPKLFARCLHCTLPQVIPVC